MSPPLRSPARHEHAPSAPPADDNSWPEELPVVVHAEKPALHATNTNTAGTVPWTSAEQRGTMASSNEVVDGCTQAALSRNAHAHTLVTANTITDQGRQALPEQDLRSSLAQGSSVAPSSLALESSGAPTKRAQHDAAAVQVATAAAGTLPLARADDLISDSESEGQAEGQSHHSSPQNDASPREHSKLESSRSVPPGDMAQGIEPKLSARECLEGPGSMQTAMTGDLALATPAQAVGLPVVQPCEEAAAPGPQALRLASGAVTPYAACQQVSQQPSAPGLPPSATVGAASVALEPAPEIHPARSVQSQLDGSSRSLQQAEAEAARLALLLAPAVHRQQPNQARQLSIIHTDRPTEQPLNERLPLAAEQLQEREDSMLQLGGRVSSSAATSVQQSMAAPLAGTAQFGSAGTGKQGGLQQPATGLAKRLMGADAAFTHGPQPEPVLAQGRHEAADTVDTDSGHETLGEASGVAALMDAADVIIPDR